MAGTGLLSALLVVLVAIAAALYVAATTTQPDALPPAILPLVAILRQHLPTSLTAALEAVTATATTAGNWATKSKAVAAEEESYTGPIPETCQFFPNGFNHIDAPLFKGVRFDPADAASIDLRKVATTLGMNLPGLPHEYSLRNEAGDVVSSPADCKRYHGHLYLLRRGDLWVWPAVAHNSKITISLRVEGSVERLELETISSKPRLLWVENFISEDERKVLLDLAENRMHRSTLHSAEGEKADTTRTSENAWVFNSEHPLLMRMDLRISELLRIPPELVPDAGATQVLRYLPGQYYHLHHDGFTGENKDGTIYHRFNRNRFATVLYYLSDVEGGGETNFPSVNQTEPQMYDSSCNIGYNVKPKKYAAAIFYNLVVQDNMAGQLDTWAYHVACKVQSGVKWAANRWIFNKLAPPPHLRDVADPSQVGYGYDYSVPREPLTKVD